MKCSNAFWPALILALVPLSAQGVNAFWCQEYFARMGDAERRGTQFLHGRDSSLHTTEMVERVPRALRRHTGASLQKPTDKLSAWLDYLDSLYKKALSDPRSQNRFKAPFYKQFVMKPEEVPESYFEQQVRMARERGYGNITLTQAHREQLTEALLLDQKKSLDQWLDYLMSKDSEMYPMWAKYWAITGLTKLSKFNPELGTFMSRSKGTVTPYPELNREALAYVMDAVVKKVGGGSLEHIRDPELLKQLEGANFGKLYANALLRARKAQEGLSRTEGKWVLYKQGSDHKPLVKSLEGKGTGWCTAGEATAASQLKGGDFHVYYTLDAQGEATVPRVAIRMEEGQIAEVRGVAKEQNLDPEIGASDVVARKMAEFGERGAVYEKKDAHMKRLTEIEKKSQAGAALTKEDLRFLYEMDEKILGFGYGADPRIHELLAGRDVKSDLSVMLDHKYKMEEISLTKQEVLSGKSKFHYGDLDLADQASAEKLKLPETVHGNLNLNGLSSAEGLKLPKTVHGDLNLSSLSSAEGLKLPEEVRGSLFLSSLSSAEGLTLPKTVHGDLTLYGLRSAKGLTFPKTVHGSLYLSSLSSAKDLKPPEMVGEILDLGSLSSAKGLTLPKTVRGYLNLKGLKSAKGLELPKTMHGYLNLSGLSSAKGLKLPTTMYGNLNLSGLSSAKDLKLPEEVRGNLDLSGLSSAEGLKLPEGVTEYFGPKDILGY